MIYNELAADANNEPQRFIRRARQAVADLLNAQNNYQGDEIDMDDIYIVWFSKTLKNWKALLATDHPHITSGLYFETTYNGEDQELYVDTYQKIHNSVVYF